MKTVMITDCDTATSSDILVYDLNKLSVHHCIGCWTCWWKTPGRCIFKDLDQFYRDYINADKVIFMIKVSRGFISGKLKTLLDRMIPLYLPYTEYSSGESMHVPRYEHYPEIEVRYQGEFTSGKEKEIFENYIKRVFYQFHCKLELMEPIDLLNAKQGEAK